MAQFSSLSTELKLLVFKRLRESDLFESGRVSREWFSLSLLSYDKTAKEDDLLLKDLAKFYSQYSGKKAQTRWFDLLESIGSKHLEISKAATKAALKSIAKNGNRVRSLTIIRTKNQVQWEILKCLPELNTLELKNVQLNFDADVQIPEHVEHVTIDNPHVWPVRSSAALSQLFENPSAVRSLRVKTFRGSIDIQLFTSLSKLTIELHDGNDKKAILSFIKQSSSLSYVKISSGSVTKDWAKAFPENIKQIHLRCLTLEEAVKRKLGDRILYERQLLFYICRNWRSVEVFTCRSLRHTPLFPITFGSHYSAEYDAKPKEGKEYLALSMIESYGDIKDITLENSELVCLGLVISKRLFDQILFGCTPATVKFLQFHFERGTKLMFSPYAVCKDPTNLERLYVEQDLEMSFRGVQVDSFRAMTKLKSLVIPRLSDKCLTTILRDCTALKNLTIDHPKFKAFTNLPNSVTNRSVESVTIEEGDDPPAEILAHFPKLNSLVLLKHNAYHGLETPLRLLAGLSLFHISCKFDCSLATQLENVAPCSVFYGDRKKNLSCYTIGSGLKFLRNAYPEKIPYAFCRGFSTAALEAQGTKVMTDVTEFNRTANEIFSKPRGPVYYWAFTGKRRV